MIPYCYEKGTSTLIAPFFKGQAGQCLCPFPASLLAYTVFWSAKSKLRITHSFVQNLGNFGLIFREFLVNICGNPALYLGEKVGLVLPWRGCQVSFLKSDVKLWLFFNIFAFFGNRTKSGFISVGKAWLWENVAWAACSLQTSFEESSVTTHGPLNIVHCAVQRPADHFQHSWRKRTTIRSGTLSCRVNRILKKIYRWNDQCYW